MGFIDDNLMQGENIVYRTNIHWMIFIVPILLIVVSVIFINNLPSSFLTYFVVILTLFLLLRAIITYAASEFGITNKRVLIKTGFIQRNSHELLLNKIEAIQVNQGILGRMFGYGTIAIVGTGGTRDSFSNIVNSLEFRKQAQEQISKAV